MLIYNKTREDIWRNWLVLYQLLVGIVGDIPAIWIGGSFISNKVTPGDIDSVFFIHPSIIEADYSEVEHKFLGLVANNNVEQLGIKADTFIVPFAPPKDASFPEVGTITYMYALRRGYWDNLWEARRGDGTAPLLPFARGYLEVISDGAIKRSI